MARKKGRYPASRDSEACVYRSALVVASGADDDERSIPLVLATETPVPVYDFERTRVVKEQLAVSGVEHGGACPLLASHDRATGRSGLGSIRELTVSDTRLIGRAFFAKSESGIAAYELYRDGHLTDFSVGCRIEEIERDESGNRTVVRSRLLEGSAVVAGQDPDSKALISRRCYTEPEQLADEEERKMDEQIRKTLLQSGLPDGATDAEAVEYLQRSLTKAEIDTPDTVTVPESQPDNNEELVKMSDQTTAERTDDSAGVPAHADIKEIDELCELHAVGSDLRRELITDPSMTIDRASRKILDSVAPSGTGGAVSAHIGAGVSETEKFYGELEGAIMGRMVTAGVLPASQAARDVPRDLEFSTLPDIAQQLLERDGQRTMGLPRQEIIRRAFRQPDYIQRGAGHTSGSFPSLMLDAANKTLLNAYASADTTYQIWARQGLSAPDYRPIHRVRMGDFAAPEVIPEGQQYPERGAQSSRETYAVEKHGAVFSVSLEAVVNDDLGAIINTPRAQGFAMRQAVNTAVYAVLTSNEAMSDSISLFHATSHGANLDATALSEAALDVGFEVMSGQTSVSGAIPIGLTPQFLVVPPGLASTAQRLTQGGVVATASSSVALYGDGRARPLTVVADASLTAASATQWFLVSASPQCDTVEYTFLQGEEQPVLSREEDFETDSLAFKIRQSFGVAAVDFRGMYQGNA